MDAGVVRQYHLGLERNCPHYTYLQDFNMVKIQSRPQTIVLNGLKRLIAYMVPLNEVGSENYSGKKIPWAEWPLWVRIPLALRYRIRSSYFKIISV